MDQKAKILDIAMNLNRIGNWAADDFNAKRGRIEMFLDQTTNYISAISRPSLPKKFKETFEIFIPEYQKLAKEAKNGPKNTMHWAEKLMTWGNILTHRANLI